MESLSPFYVGSALLTDYIPTLRKLHREASTRPTPVLRQHLRGTPLSVSPRAFSHPQAPNPDTAHLDRVQGVPHKHQAHAAKASGQEVLKRTDGLRLFCHGQSSLSSGDLGLARLPRLHDRFRRPFAYIRVGGVLGRSEGGPSRPSLASARSLLPAAAPPYGRGFL